MASSPNFKVVSVNPHHNYGKDLEKYRSVNVENIPTSERVSTVRYTLFTLERVAPGDTLSINQTEELTAVLGQTSMFVYRPNSALSPYFNVVSSLPSEGIGLPEDNFYLIERAAKKGYDPLQSKILSAMNFTAGDQMQADMIHPYTTQRNGEKIYRHDDKAFQKRLWEATREFCR